MRKDINLAILRMEATPSQKITARIALADYSTEEISSVEFRQWWPKRPLVKAVETLRGKPLNVSFVEEASFFYGLKIDSVEQFTKMSYDTSYENYDVNETNWSQVTVIKDPIMLERATYYYDMILVNGKFWTFARYLPKILELAIFE